ncbi:MAG: pyridoxal-phosphate dependent enzyme [Bacteroidales bacterium]|nr:pyridoxal-phosphate dependent enzyme [Bacteroidales bacterium]
MIPSKDDLIRAHSRIKSYIHSTPLMRCESIDKICGATIQFKCENLQKAGAFKSRGASNAVFKLMESGFTGRVATHSSGNHAQALSRVAKFAGIEAHVVMPENSLKSKIAAVQEYHADITFCIPTLEARESTLAKVMQEVEAVEIHPYDNYDIIAGQATAAKEILEDYSPDIIIAPVGGGGLLSGTALAAKYFGNNVKVFAAEPEMANDAKLSFDSKTFVPSVNPQTIADGLRTSLGDLTFPIILDHVDEILTCSEDSIVKAMRLMWERAKIMAEPSSAAALAIVMNHPEIFKGKNIAIIVSGGNADLDNLPW